MKRNRALEIDEVGHVIGKPKPAPKPERNAKGKRKTMNNTLQDIIKKGVAACLEHGFSFIQLYKLVNEENVKDGWDLYTISPVHLSENEYYYCGVIRADGTTDIRQ